MGSGSGVTRLGCGTKFIKFILVCFNLLFFLLGIAILAIGIYVLVDPKFVQIKNLANVDVASTAAKNGIDLTYINKCGIAFCVFGGVMFMISFMGCCGAIKQVKCLLGMYSSILLALLLAEIALGIFAAIYAGKLKDVLSPALKQSIKDQYLGDDSNKTLVSVAWDAFMYNIQCCGVDNSTDFNQVGNIWKNRGNATIPRSCCKFNKPATDWSGNIPYDFVDSACYITPTTNNSYYDNGCYDRMQSLVNQYSSIVIGVAIGIGLVLLLGVIFGFHLCRKVNELEDVV